MRDFTWFFAGGALVTAVISTAAYIGVDNPPPPTEMDLAIIWIEVVALIFLGWISNP